MPELLEDDLPNIDSFHPPWAAVHIFGRLVLEKAWADQDEPDEHTRHLMDDALVEHGLPLTY